MLTLAADYLLAESMALAWHVRHGFHVEMNGIRFKVPLLYYEDHGSNMLELSLSTIPGRLNKKEATIVVDFHRQRPLSEDKAEVGGARLQKWGMSRSGTRTIQMVGRTGSCTDFTGKSASIPSPYVVDCSFGDEMRIHFFGTENAVADFYSILQSAEVVRGKI
ncbi:MAG TPA: hypothetical protein VE783_08050 [Candidatus Limnocylindrales bacterium]|nr:hypothetical protein [Candidatus Limnocylindrales bacterium]